MTSSAARRYLRLSPDRVKELILLGIIVGSVVIFGSFVDGYLSGRFFNRVTTSVVIVAILAAAQALVIFSRNIDLSVGSTVGVSAYLTADFLTSNTWATPVVAMIIAIAVGAVLGSLNGLLVAYGRVPAIIVTLGTLAIFRTLISLYSGGANVLAGDLPDWVLGFNNLTVLSIAGFDLRLVFLIAVAVVVILQWALRRLRVGRRLYAIGSNPDAARQAGLAAPRLIMFSFVGAGALAGLAGFMFMARAGTISATAGSGLELESVAAAVVGGVSIFGGSGTMFGAFLGATLIDTLELSLVRVPEVSEFLRDAALGILILLAVILDATLQRRFTRRLTRAVRGPDAIDRQSDDTPLSSVTGGGSINE
ncbi:MAG TPA: ABC transporter permease [Acidimicrobiia bacterium]|nr:ABC transporter permease [Acidimicrobiia bacterium]